MWGMNHSEVSPKSMTEQLTEENKRVPLRASRTKKKYLTLITHAAFLIDVFCKQNYSISFSCYIRKLIYVYIVFCLCIKFSNVFIYILNYSLHLHAHVNFLPFNHKVFVTIDDILAP